MTTVWVKQTFHDCVARICLKIDTIFLVDSFFMAIEFLMGVLTITFASPIE